MGFDLSRGKKKNKITTESMVINSQCKHIHWMNKQKKSHKHKID